MNLGTHRSRTAERSATGADTEGCAPLDTTATSHGGDKEPCPGLQKSSGTPTEDDLGTHQVGQLQGAETDGGAALHFDTMSE